MKTFRVTLLITRGNNTCSHSYTIPAPTEQQAIESSKRNVSGQVVSESVELINL